MQKKTSLTALIALIAAGSLSGCNLMQSMGMDVASSCEQGIKNLNQHLKNSSLRVNQTNISRANSLLVAAKVQLQFAEYPGCVDKVKRANDYLSGRQTVIFSRLSI